MTVLLECYDSVKDDMMHGLQYVWYTQIIISHSSIQCGIQKDKHYYNAKEKLYLAACFQIQPYGQIGGSVSTEFIPVFKTQDGSSKVRSQYLQNRLYKLMGHLTNLLYYMLLATSTLVDYARELQHPVMKSLGIQDQILLVVYVSVVSVFSTKTKIISVPVPFTLVVETVIR